MTLARCAPLFVALACGVGGCEKPKPPPRPAPGRTIETLSRIRLDRAYDQLAAHMPHAAAQRVRAVLEAVDEFERANDAMLAAARQLARPDVVAALDQRHLFARLDAFSPEVAIMSVVMRGDAADVSFLANATPPLRRATLQWSGDHWEYDPGPGFDDRLPDAIREMAAGLEQFAETMRAGDYPRADVAENPSILMEALRARLAPGLRNMPTEPE